MLRNRLRNPVEASGTQRKPSHNKKNRFLANKCKRLGKRETSQQAHGRTCSG